MAKSKIVTLPVLEPAQTPRTEADLLQALENFAMTSVRVVDLDNTVTALETLTEIVASFPHIYQKLFLPENIALFKDMIEQNSGKKEMGMMEQFAMMGKIKTIFS